MENPVLIIGANAMGKAALDIFKENNVVVYGFLDDEEALHGTEILETVVLGSSEDEQYLGLISGSCEYFVASEDNVERDAISNLIQSEQKKKGVNAIHNRSIISNSCLMGHGNMIDSGTILKAHSEIGDGCNLNSSVVIGVESKLGDYVQVGMGSLIQDGVTVADQVFIGAGSVLVSGITIGKNAQIGAGSVVIADVPEGQRVFGNPAKSM